MGKIREKESHHEPMGTGNTSNSDDEKGDGTLLGLAVKFFRPLGNRRSVPTLKPAFLQPRIRHGREDDNGIAGNYKKRL